MASPFYGGPERQMLGFARYLPDGVRSSYLSFAERGLARQFLTEVRREGFEGKLLAHNTPRVVACIREVASELRRLRPDVLCCSGYKPDLVGWRAARQAGIPVVSVSHGWTAATWRVSCYDALNRYMLRWMDAVICVSNAQADKVRRAKVPESKIAVIRNAVGEDAFVEPSESCRREMLAWFAQPPRWLIGAAGRLSPEKGFSVFIESAAAVLRQRPDAGFVLFGDGPLRCGLEQSIAAHGIAGRVVLAGFRNDLSRFLPNLDINVMTSFTEGLPVILLEAGAAGVPSVATAVGGIPEVVENGISGYLVPAGDTAGVAQRIIELIDDESKRRSFGAAARDRVRRDFSFVSMSQQYYELFLRLARSHRNRMVFRQEVYSA